MRCVEVHVQTSEVGGSEAWQDFGTYQIAAAGTQGSQLGLSVFHSPGKQMRPQPQRHSLLREQQSNRPHLLRYIGSVDHHHATKTQRQMSAIRWSAARETTGAWRNPPAQKREPGSQCTKQVAEIVGGYLTLNLLHSACFCTQLVVE
jgi:hypothetical protein